MIRITIEVEGTASSSTTVQREDSAYLPAPERLTPLTGASPIDAGSAPREAPGIAAIDAAPAIDAGAFREQPTSPDDARAADAGAPGQRPLKSSKR